MNCCSLLLHLVRASLNHDETGNFKDALLLRSDDLNDEEPHSTPKSAFKFFLSDSNMRRKIYPEREVIEEKEVKMDGKVEVVV